MEYKTRHYLIKEPIQRRSKETVSSIVESCTNLLSSRPYFEITTDNIAENAGVSIGSLYQFFSSKEAIAAAVVDNILNEDIYFISSEMSQMLPSDPALKIKKFIDLVFQRQNDKPKLRVALSGIQGLLGTWNVQPLITAQYKKIIVQIIPKNIGQRNNEILSCIITNTILSSIHIFIQHRESIQQIEQQEELKKELVLLVLKYIHSN